MAAKSPLRFLADVPADRLVKLPDDVPVGPAEIVVLTSESRAPAVDRMRLARDLQRSAPRQATDSAELLRADRDAR